MQVFAQFSCHISDRVSDSIVTKLPSYPHGTFIPYIYSQKEVEVIFKASDKLRLGRRFMTSSLFSVPTLLRLLYSTGVRIGEALDLKEEDVNLDEKFLRIKDSKNGKQRIIHITDSLLSVCKQYVIYKDKLPL